MSKALTQASAASSSGSLARTGINTLMPLTLAVGAIGAGLLLAYRRKA